MPQPDLPGFTRSEFSHDGATRELYIKGDGPAVIVMTEMPGITPKVIEFAEYVVERGFTVYMPHLFGVPGADPSITTFGKAMVPMCVSKEFVAFACGKTAPVQSWLRALARHAHAECGGPGVGAIGMCFTGGFALGMMVDESVLAPVLSQPSLPLPLGASRKADIHLSPEDLAAVKARADQGVCVLGMRFTNDSFVPAERFEALRRELGDRFIGVEIDSSPGNEWGIKKSAHSVVTEDLVTDVPGHPTALALEQVLTFFADRLIDV